MRRGDAHQRAIAAPLKRGSQSKVFHNKDVFRQSVENVTGAHGVALDG